MNRLRALGLLSGMTAALLTSCKATSNLSELNAISETDRMDRFLACMAVEDWQKSGMEKWAQRRSSVDLCVSCHENGAGSFFLSSDLQKTFKFAKLRVYSSAWFIFGTDIKPNIAKFAAIGSGASGHPIFSTTASDPYMASLQHFADLTNRREESGSCGAGSGQIVCDGPECGG